MLNGSVSCVRVYSDGGLEGQHMSILSTEEVKI